MRHDHQRVVATHMRHIGQDGRRAGQHMQHPFNYLADVGPALAQVFVFHGIELLAQHLALRRQRPFGVVVAFSNKAKRLLGQQGIAQQQAVHVQHGAQLARRVGRQRIGQLPKFMLRRRQRLGQAAAFGRHVLGGNSVVRHFQRRGAHDDRAPDGISLRNAFAIKTNDGTGAASPVVGIVQGRRPASLGNAQAGGFRGCSIPAHRICCRTEFRFRKALARHRCRKRPV
ncbi:hypothetical protein D3C73_1154380 [compost metagenome]